MTESIETFEAWHVVTRIPESDDWEAQDLVTFARDREHAREILALPNHQGLGYPEGTRRFAVRKIYTVTSTEEVNP